MKRSLRTTPWGQPVAGPTESDAAVPMGQLALHLQRFDALDESDKITFQVQEQVAVHCRGLLKLYLDHVAGGDSIQLDLVLTDDQEQVLLKRTTGRVLLRERDRDIPLTLYPAEGANVASDAE